MRYRYDPGSDRVVARTETPPGAGGVAKTRLYFYWGNSPTLAEETDGAGNTLVRYFNDGNDGTLGQRTWRVAADGHRDATDTAGTWAWLCADVDGSVGTHVSDAGQVLEQAAYNPYGAPQKGGSLKRSDAPGSTLGFQTDHTDRFTGSVLMGPRQYDPSTARFVSPDTFVDPALDLGLGTDQLTGNRYLFAAANPVAFFEDGHGPCRRGLSWKWCPSPLPACRQISFGDHEAVLDRRGVSAPRLSLHASPQTD